MVKLTKNEVRDLERYGYNIKKVIEPTGQIVDGVIIVSHGRLGLHDSGYPFIKVFGFNKQELIDLGWHDHVLLNVRSNIDSIGKNIFRIMKWISQQQWKIQDDFISCSSLMVGDVLEDGSSYVTIR